MRSINPNVLFPLSNQSGGGGGTGPLDPAKVYKETRPSDWMVMPKDDDSAFGDPDHPVVYGLMNISVDGHGFLRIEATGSNITVEFGETDSDGIFTTRFTEQSSRSPFQINIKDSQCVRYLDDGSAQIMFRYTAPSANGTIRFTKDGTKNNTQDIVEIKTNSAYFDSAGGNQQSHQPFHLLRYLTCLTPLRVSLIDKFSKCYSLIAILQLGTSNVTNMYGMFSGCGNLIAIPQLDTSNVTNMGSMFSGCCSLTTIPQLDTSSVTSMDSMFNGCSSLTTIPQMDTRNVESMATMFQNCSALRNIPQLDTSNVTNMNSMFSGCHALEAIPELDTRNVTNMYNMFRGCQSLQNVSLSDTGKVTTMQSMFQECYSLRTVELEDTSRVTSMASMFQYCYGLQSISRLKVTNVRFSSGTINYCYSLQRLLFDPSEPTSLNQEIYLRNYNFSHENLLALFNSLPTVTGTGTLTLTGVSGVSELTDTEKAIATDKGWTLTI